MDNEESLDAQNTSQYCRLCFHWTENTLCAKQLIDIFSFNKRFNCTLAEKIHDCLGLQINPDDARCKICSNCENTICFIDEFRFLCRQTEKTHESALLRLNDVSRWECYNKHVCELRTLVRELKDTVDNTQHDARLESPAVDDIDNILSPEFITVKEEENEFEPGDNNDESLTEVKIELESFEPVSVLSDYKTTTAEDKDSEFLTKLKIARELQAQVSDKPDMKSVSQKIGLEVHEIEQLWKEMGVFYRMTKKRAYAGRKPAIACCRECPLFSILNIIIPKFKKVKPFEECRIKATLSDRVKMSIDVLVAIAEEIKAHPEMWGLSQNSTPQSKKILWKNMERKFKMDMRTLRAHFKRLRIIYRTHKLRELKGIQKQEPPNEKYDYLLSVLHEILASTTFIQLPVNSTEQIDVPEDEIEQIFAEGKGDNQKKKKQLALAQEIQKCPIIWSYKHPDFHNTEMRDQTWQNIAEISRADREAVKQEWERLKDMFRNRNLRLLKGKLKSDDALIVDPLYKVLDEMFQGNKRFTELKDEDNLDTKFDDETKLEFAKVCHDHDILWNMNHPNYTAQDKRNEVLNLISLQFGVSLEKIKNEWMSLRAMYRKRYLRSQNSSIKRDGKKSNEPLHQLMKVMFEKHMLKLYEKGFEAKQITGIDQKHSSASGGQLKMAKEISMHEAIWNKKHPHYSKTAIREAAFGEVAAKLGHPTSFIKEEWKNLRVMHQHRQRLIARGRLDQIQNGVDPLHALLDKLLSSKPSKSTSDADSMKEEETYPKRRYTGKRSFSNDGCMQIEAYGSLRYAKVCELCGKQIERSLFEYHMNAHYGLTPYACSFEGCDKQYSNRTVRDKHEIAIHGEDGYVFQCDQCDKKFKQKSKYQYHYAVKHKSEEIACDVCGKVVKHKNLLRKHMEIHTASYECHVCGKVLQKKYSLNVHMRVHTKEKPFPCEMCEQRFMLKVQMKTHLLKVHGVALETMQSTATASKS